MHYLVRLKTDGSADLDVLAGRDDLYLSPEGDRGWAIVEADDEESLRGALGGQAAEEVQPVLPARQYRAVQEARRGLEESKARFVDDPPGALEDARQWVRRALEARGYPPPERANEAPASRQEVLRAFHDTGESASGSLEEQKSSFNRLSDLLDRIARA